VAIFQWNWVDWYQNVSTPDISGAKDDRVGRNNRSYKKCKAAVKSSPTSTARMTFLSSVQQCQITKAKKTRNSVTA